MMLIIISRSMSVVMQSVIILSVAFLKFLLSVIMLIVIKLNVMAFFLWLCLKLHIKKLPCHGPRYV